METKDKILAGVAAAGVIGAAVSGLIGGKESPVVVEPVPAPIVQRQSAIKLEVPSAGKMFVIRESKLASDDVRGIALSRAQAQLQIGQRLDPTVTNIPPREIRLGMVPHSLIAREQALQREERR